MGGSSGLSGETSWWGRGRAVAARPGRHLCPEDHPLIGDWPAGDCRAEEPDGESGGGGGGAT